MRSQVYDYPPHVSLNSSSQQQQSSSNMNSNYFLPLGPLGTNPVSGGNFNHPNSESHNQKNLGRNNQASNSDSYPSSFENTFQSISSYITHQSREDPCVFRLQQYITTYHSDIINQVARKTLPSQYFAGNTGANSWINNSMRERIFFSVCVELHEVLRQWCQSNASPSSYWIYNDIYERFYAHQKALSSSVQKMSPSTANPMGSYQQQQQQQQQHSFGQSSFPSQSAAGSMFSQQGPSQQNWAQYQKLQTQMFQPSYSNNGQQSQSQQASFSNTRHGPHSNDNNSKTNSNGGTMREHSLFQNNGDYPMDLSRMMSKQNNTQQQQQHSSHSSLFSTNENVHPRQPLENGARNSLHSLPAEGSNSHNRQMIPQPPSQQHQSSFYINMNPHNFVQQPPNGGGSNAPNNYNNFTLNDNRSSMYSHPQAQPPHQQNPVGNNHLLNGPSGLNYLSNYNTDSQSYSSLYSQQQQQQQQQAHKDKNSLASSTSNMPPMPQQHPDHHYPSFWLYNIGNTEFYVTSNYEARNILGFGAYGIVISAYDSKSESEVAIKKQNLSNFGGNREYLKRLLREICILHHVDHPNLMCLVDLIPPFDYQHFESVYIVTQRMDHSLKDVIHSKQELKQEHIDFFMYQMTSAIRYLHACQLLHRDLKPENVLINDNCELRLSDFGLSKSIPLGLNPKNSTSIVSLFYRAPELLLGINQCSPSVDIWSLGTIFAEMYYPPRKPLFQSNSCFDALSKILSLIGTPSMSDFEGLSDQISSEGYQYLTTLPHYRRRNFREVFPLASPEALDLIEKMLVFNPARRISAEEALRHPYFKDIQFHEEEFNYVCERMDTSWEDEFSNQKKDPKRILYDKIVEFNLQQNNCLVGTQYHLLGEKFCVTDEFTELDS